MKANNYPSIPGRLHSFGYTENESNEIDYKYHK